MKKTYFVAIAWPWHGGYGQPVVDELIVQVVEDIDCFPTDVLATWGGIPCPIRAIEADNGLEAGIAYLTPLVKAWYDAREGPTWDEDNAWDVNRMVVDADGDCSDWVPISGIWVKEKPQ